MKKLLLLVILSVFSTAQADERVYGCRDAYLSRNYDQAFPICSHFEHMKNEDVIFALAYMYVNGLGTEKNYDKAFDLFNSIANGEYEHAEVYYNLGMMHNFGRGTPVNHVKALEYYEKAANGKHFKASYNAGVLYLERGSFYQAKRYLQKAVENSYSPAYLNYGVLFADPKFNNVDLIEAYAWFTLAADDPYLEEDALINLKEVKKYLNPKQLKEGYDRYRTYRQKYNKRQ